MSSSLSELRNFRLNKANANGASSSSKLASGRKRIRAMSDSSDEEQAQKPTSTTTTTTPTKPTTTVTTSTTTTPTKSPTQNGIADEKKLSVKEKEERYHLFREIVGKNVDSLTLQDFLVQNDWDVQKAYDALQENPQYQQLPDKSSPKSVQSIAVSSSKFTNKSPELVKSKKHNKVSRK